MFRSEKEAQMNFLMNSNYTDHSITLLYSRVTWHELHELFTKNSLDVFQMKLTQMKIY